MTLKKDFFKLMNNTVFGEIMEKIKVVSEPNYHTTMAF